MYPTNNPLRWINRWPAKPLTISAPQVSQRMWSSTVLERPWFTAADSSLHKLDAANGYP
jgi:hypothetical protein